MSDPLLALRNIGPKTAAALRAAGLDSPEAVRELGTIAVYERLVAQGAPDNLNLLWALEGAVTDRDFLDIARNERERLLTELDAAREWHAIQ